MSDNKKFFVEYYVNFIEDKKELINLAREYIKRTDDFDNLICTGPVDEYGSKIPMSSYERTEMTRNAFKIMNEITERVNKLGFSQKELRKEISREEYFMWRKFNK